MIIEGIDFLLELFSYLVFLKIDITSIFPRLFIYNGTENICLYLYDAF
jgi:hypothetical protein